MAEAPVALPESLQGIAKQGKKRKNKNKNLKRGPTALAKNRGSGFEEYYADPPMTPTEAKEEKNEIYSPDLPFSERMQSCIQRFRSRRRLQGDRILYFSEYLFLGGVDTSPNVFGGLSQQELKELTPAERREATATDIIWANSQAGEKFYDGDDEKWTVDFAAVVAGFFSVTLPHLTSFEPKRMEEGIDTIKNFLRYILQHDVCPEYEDSVKEAQGVCKAATVEWPMIRQLMADLPGYFNLACSELFCRESVDASWSFQTFQRPENFDPKAVFFAAFALMDEPELFEKLSAKEPTVVREFTCTLELVQIFRPKEDIVKRFNSLVIGDKATNHVPVGKAIFKRGIIEDGWYNPRAGWWPIEEDTMTLFFDDALLANMMPGLKATTTICELDAGLRFIKTLQIAVPSFYVFLPQELMRHYKEPKDNDRAAPSANSTQKGNDVAEDEDED
ncbi:Argonaute-binding 1 [Fusarium beomiforme]|uniref:Argonaute-binding 1 n=1 Tax=Fusarium beomiforme TaxID=44412 RepID=A0A9P5AJC8_9HYPO|nr:Argonaute-binding 1 [Fusarium beomiforme]